MANGRWQRICSRAATILVWPLPITATRSVHPVERSVAQRVQIHSPDVGNQIDLQLAGGVQLPPLVHHQRHLAAQQPTRFGPARPRGHQTPPEVVQAALHRGEAGPNQRRAGLRGTVRLPVPPQPQQQIREQGLQPFGAQIIGCLPADLECPAELQPIPPGPRRAPLGRDPLAPPEYSPCVLALVSRGQAETVQDLAALSTPRPPIPRCQLLSQLVPLPDSPGLGPLTSNLRRAALGAILGCGSDRPTV